MRRVARLLVPVAISASLGGVAVAALGSTTSPALVYVVAVPTSIDWLDVGARASASSFCATAKGGSAEVRLYQGGDSDTSPSLSSRGDLAFVRYAGDTSELMLLPAGTRTPRSLATIQGTVDLEPAWSPDGALLAFSSGDVEVIAPQSGARRTVAAAGTGPAWSSDGRRLAFARAGETWTVGADGSGAVDVGRGGDPSWSPAGDELAVDVQVAPGQWQIDALSAAGGSPRVLSSVTATAAPRPAWSPDGTVIAFTASSSSPPSATGGRLQSDVFTINATGGSPTNLTMSAVSETGVRWSTGAVPPLAHLIAGCGGVSGTAGDDRISLGPRGNTVFGLAGDDRIAGSAGPDILFGNAGRDRLVGGPGNDQLEGDDYGGRGFADVLYGGSGNDVLRGEGGNDRLYGGSGNDILGAVSPVSSIERPPGPGEGGNDTMEGGAGSDWLFGGPGNDRLNGGSGNDVIDGGPGNDTIYARDGRRDVIACGPGRDTVYPDKSDVVARDCERVLHR